MTIKILNCLYTGKNPYQSLIYASLDQNMECYGGKAKSLTGLKNSDYDILHIHWDDRLFTPPSGTRDYMETLFDEVTQFQQRGGKLLWTIHNRSPHRGFDEARFTNMRKRLAIISDAIHVHAEHAKDYAVTELNADPKKVFVLPHPSYHGEYIAEGEERGAETFDDRRFLSFGMMRGNKGGKSLAFVFEKLHRQGFNCRLDVCGSFPHGAKSLKRRLDKNPLVHVRDEFIPDQDVAGIFKNSQIFIAPFDNMFTSGSIMLAMTFGLPVIGPDTREMRETLPSEAHSLLYDTKNPRGFIRSLKRAISLPDDALSDIQKACYDFALARHPSLISGQLTSQIRQLTEAKPSLERKTNRL